MEELLVTRRGITELPVYRLENNIQRLDGRVFRTTYIKELY